MNEHQALEEPDDLTTVSDAVTQSCNTSHDSRFLRVDVARRAVPICSGKSPAGETSLGFGLPSSTVVYLFPTVRGGLFQGLGRMLALLSSCMWAMSVKLTVVWPVWMLGRAER